MYCPMKGPERLSLYHLKKTCMYRPMKKPIFLYKTMHVLSYERT